MKTEKFNITGMTCAACQAAITRNVSKLPGVEKVEVSLLSNQMQVSFDEKTTDAGQIIRTVEGIGYGASLPGEAASGGQNDFRSEWKDRRKREEDEQMKRRRMKQTN